MSKLANAPNLIIVLAETYIVVLLVLVLTYSILITTPRGTYLNSLHPILQKEGLRHREFKYLAQGLIVSKLVSTWSRVLCFNHYDILTVKIWLLKIFLNRDITELIKVLLKLWSLLSLLFIFILTIQSLDFQTNKRTEHISPKIRRLSQDF